MKKFICNRNGKAVFQEGDRELVAAYQMKSSPVPVTPRKLKAEMEAIARTARLSITLANGAGIPHSGGNRFLRRSNAMCIDHVLTFP
ncbi:hypothetical protein OV916_25595, partial [Salmonella enterica subsp. enterica serovar 1,4,[5],12:i:-]|nr:hypothetical protein [Salmonella enterica subsp. enterica serovar 1,4,[5],12:i:-]